jgi:molybdopterin-guanine dinucleotide biosynthesis protein A
MGTDKAVLPIAGRAMARRVADALVAAGASRVVAIGGDAAALAALGLEVVPDEDPGGGPLGATRTALRTSGHDVVAVVGCDLLDPDPAALRTTVRALLDDPDAHVAAPIVDGHRQWVHAAWRVSALPVLDQGWADGTRSLRRVADRLHVAEVSGLPPSAVADADAPTDLPGPPAGPG